MGLKTSAEPRSYPDTPVEDDICAVEVRVSLAWADTVVLGEEKLPVKQMGAFSVETRMGAGGKKGTSLAEHHILASVAVEAYILPALAVGIVVEDHRLPGLQTSMSAVEEECILPG